MATRPQKRALDDTCQPLLVSAVDYNGEAVVRYVQDEIRTTKHAVFTFIPRIYSSNSIVCPLPDPCPPSALPSFRRCDAVTVLPLVYIPTITAIILTVTTIKDTVEDYRWARLDKQVSTSTVTKLAGGRKNVNHLQDPRNWLEKSISSRIPSFPSLLCAEQSGDVLGFLCIPKVCFPCSSTLPCPQNNI